MSNFTAPSAKTESECRLIRSNLISSCLLWPDFQRTRSFEKPGSPPGTIFHSIPDSHFPEFSLPIFGPANFLRASHSRFLTAYSPAFSPGKRYPYYFYRLYQWILSDNTGQEDMKKARFYAGLIHLLDFWGANDKLSPTGIITCHFPSEIIL